MRASTLGSLVALAAALSAPRAAVQSSPPPIPPELRARFGFVGPEIVKIGEGIRSLRIARSAGLTEIVLEDPRRARLEFRTWNGGGFDTRSEPTAGSIAGLAVEDFDGDGRADLAILDGRGRLRLRLRGAEDGDPLDLGLAASADALRSADLDGDGRPDLVAWTRDGLRTVQDLAGTPRIGAAMPLDEGTVRALHLHDVDGDGRADLVVALGVERMPLRIKRGLGDGTFGPWLILDLPQLRDAFPGTGVGGIPTLATIEGPHRRVVEHRLREDPDGTALQLDAVPEGRSKSALPFAVGDLDGDGDLDLAVALPDQAALLLLLDEGGSFARRQVATFAGVSGIAIGDLDGDGRQDLLVASPDEGALGWTRGGEPLDAFPTRLPARDLPVAVAVHAGRALVICKDERRQARLVEVGADGSLRERCDLGRLGGDPLRLLCAELDDEDGAELAYVVPGEGLRAVTGINGEARQIEAEAGFTKRMDDGALALDLSGELPTLLLAREQFVRAFRFGPDGQPEILDQDGGPAGRDGLNLVATTAAGTRLLYDRKGDRLYRVAAGGPARSVDVPPLGFSHLVALGEDAVLLGPKGVLRVPFGRGHALDALRSHEPPTDDTRYLGGLAADLDGDGNRELAILDGDLHGLQVLVAEGETLQRALAWPIFELPDAGSDLGEPREICVADIDGDGRDDLVALCFDRLLVFRQQD
jgi:hypothetical protein